MNLPLNKDFLQMSTSVIQGTIPCMTAAPAIASDAGSSIIISLTNINSSSNVYYAVYNNLTGGVVATGSLPKGNSRSVNIPASNTGNVVRIQNQSPCDINNITPTLSYAAVVQQP
jgi:hypothetical protein